MRYVIHFKHRPTPRPEVVDHIEMLIDDYEPLDSPDSARSALLRIGERLLRYMASETDQRWTMSEFDHGMGPENIRLPSFEVMLLMEGSIENVYLWADQEPQDG